MANLVIIIALPIPLRTSGLCMIHRGNIPAVSTRYVLTYWHIPLHPKHLAEGKSICRIKCTGFQGGIQTSSTHPIICHHSTPVVSALLFMVFHLPCTSHYSMSLAHIQLFCQIRAAGQCWNIGWLLGRFTIGSVFL